MRLSDNVTQRCTNIHLWTPGQMPHCLPPFLCNRIAGRLGAPSVRNARQRTTSPYQPVSACRSASQRCRGTETPAFYPITRHAILPDVVN